MKEGQLYKTVYIHSVDDLPKKEGEYKSCTKKGKFVKFVYSLKFRMHMLAQIDWYFQPIEQPEEKTAEEECTIDEEKILILFTKHSNCLGKSPIKLPCMTRSAFVAAVKEYAAQSKSQSLPCDKQCKGCDVPIPCNLECLPQSQLLPIKCKEFRYGNWESPEHIADYFSRHDNGFDSREYKKALLDAINNLIHKKV